MSLGLLSRTRSLAVVKNVTSKFQSIQYRTGRLDRPAILESLAASGYCFYRGTNLQNDLLCEDDAHFHATTQHLYTSLFGEDYESKLMSYGSGTDSRDIYKKSKLLTVSRVSNRMWISYHSELTYTDQFPRLVAFVCVKPSEAGGCTPVSNVIDTWLDLPSAMRRKFEQHGIRYIRNLRDKVAEDSVENNPLDLNGQKFVQDIFGTNDGTQLQAMCDRQGYGYEWRTCPWNNTPILRIQNIMPAVVDHQYQNKTVRSFANAGTSMNARYFQDYGDTFYEELKFADRPFHSQWGNGDEFDDEEYATIERCYHANSMCFQWEAGDVFIADNLVWSHGRTPYEGERHLLAIMGHPTIACKIPKQ